MGYFEQFQASNPDLKTTTPNHEVTETLQTTRTMPAMAPLSQCFVNAELEDAFRVHYQLKTQHLSRIAIVLGVAIFAAFGLLDLLVAPAHVTALWTIRYALICPLGLGLLGISYSAWGQEHLPILTGTFVSASGLGTVAMTALLPPTLADAYCMGLVLTVLYGFTVSQLRWNSANLTGATIVLAYEVVSIPRLPTDLLITNNFFLLSSMIIGIIACWELERFHRRGFLHIREIQTQRRALSAAYKLLEKEASRDPLTGLQNRRHLEERIKDASGLSRRYGIPTCALMIDLDNFKRVNDTLGHPVGDDLLRAVANCLATIVRDTDGVFRIGGDEFLVLLRGTPMEASLDAMKRIEEALSALYTEGPWQELELGTSAGLVIVDPTKTPAEILESADRSLYTVKQPTTR